MLAWNEVLTDLAWHEILTDISDHRLENPSPRNASRPILIYIEFSGKLSLGCHSAVAQQINCDKILFSHTRRCYQFLFLFFFLFRFYVMLCYLFCYYKSVYKNYFIIIFFFHKNYLKFFHVPGCSEIFRNVPCSWFFWRPISTGICFLRILLHTDPQFIRILSKLEYHKLVNSKWWI